VVKRASSGEIWQRIFDATVNRSGGGLLVQLEGFPAIASTIALRGDRWKAKKEFHVTLIGSGREEELARGKAAASADEAIDTAVEGRRFTVRLREEAWRVSRGRERTIIVLCEVEGAEEFFTRLEEVLGSSIERPPYHVTIYTVGSQKGIGLATRKELERKGSRLTPDEMEELRRQIGET
jgi:hypothetical protein